MSLSTPSNPSHLLINRNPPLPAHPQLTSRHSASHSRQHSAPVTSGDTVVRLFSSRDSIDQAGVLGDDRTDDSGQDVVEEEEEVIVHPTFERDSQLRGRVKVIVGRNEFWCHKEVLWFASPFFQGLLQGNWAENTRHSPTITSSRQSSSPTDTNFDPALLDEPERTNHLDPYPLTVGEDGTESEGTGSNRDVQSRKGSVYLDAVSDPMPDGYPGLGDIMRELREIPGAPSTLLGGTFLPTSRSSQDLQEALPARTSDSHIPPDDHLSSIPDLAGFDSMSRTLRHSFSSSTIPSGRGPVAPPNRARHDEPDCEAVVELHEESAAAFQDFLFWAYPHLDCKVSWTNVELLVALSTKLLVPALQGICYHFLLTHASGKPIVALALAEEYGHSELYREASRFVLDQPTWDQSEMDELSNETQLKLSQRRNWFLERLLKLGSIDVRKEYQCRPDCPDPTRCQVLVDDKWRQAHLAVCRYGPPQPSVAFRCLRQLETLPTNPSLVMPHPYCQMAAKGWIKSLFDRMFGFRLINSPQNPGTEKYWLAITLR